MHWLLGRGRRGCKRPGCSPQTSVLHAAWRDRVCRTALHWAVASPDTTSLGSPCRAHPGPPHSASPLMRAWGPIGTLWCLRRQGGLQGVGHLSWHRAPKSSYSIQPEASIRPWPPGPLPWGWRGWHPPGCCSCLAHPAHPHGAPLSELSLLPWLRGSEGHSPSDPRKGAQACLPQSPGRYPRIRVCSNHSSLLLLWASLLGPCCLYSRFPGRSQEAILQSQRVFALAQEWTPPTRGISARTGHGADLAMAFSPLWGGELPPSERSSVITGLLPRRDCTACDLA